MRARSLMIPVATLASLLAVSACENDQPGARTGAALDRAGSQTGNAVGNAASATGNALQRAGNATGTALDRAGNYVKDKVNQ